MEENMDYYREHERYLSDHESWVIEALGLKTMFSILAEYYEEQCLKYSTIKNEMDKHYKTITSALNKSRRVI